MSDAPPASPARVVIFDLGGVLVDWDPRHLFRKIIEDEAEREWFLTEVCSPAWNAEQDAGRSWADAVAEATARHPAHRAWIEAYAARWPEMMAGEIAGTVAVLEALKARGVPLFGLTNWSAETFPHARERFAWLGHFEHVLVSGEVGMKKPDPRIFRLMLQRIGVEPGAAVFIDDSIGNVEAGRAQGLRSIHFTGPAALCAHPEIAALLGG